MTVIRCKKSLYVRLSLYLHISEVGNGLIPANSNLIFELSLVKLEKSYHAITLEAKSCSADAKSRNKDKVTFDYEARLPDGK